MKPADYNRNDIANHQAWNNIESIINHLAKSHSKNIQVDFMIKYISIKLNDDFNNKNVVILSEKHIDEQGKYNQRINLSNS